jgi:hypothetical protein
VARYRLVRMALWQERWFRDLTDGQSRLYLYLLTGERTISAPGVVLAGLGTICDDLDRPAADLQAALDALCSISAHGPGGARLVVQADLGNRIIILPHELRYAAPPQNANVSKAWASNLEAAPACELRTAAIRDLAPLSEQVSQRFPQSFPYLLANDPDPEPDPVADTGSAPETPRARALVLWAYLNTGRKALGMRILGPADDRVARITRLLTSGRTDEDVRTVIDHYLANAKRDPEQQRWCDGVSMFRPENFDRGLSFADAAAAGHERPRRAAHNRGRLEPDDDDGGSK